MKVFVSWSGELSRKIAEVLKSWIPCILQSVEVFFSEDDIEKGGNWDRVVSKELSECNFGIICLTKENMFAPWVNFEAGAIAKSLDSKVSALMININPSDIKGPLSRYQATKIDEKDFYQLISSINNAQEQPVDEGVLGKAFKAIWTEIRSETNSIIEEYNKDGKSDKQPHSGQETIKNEAIEEILQILRAQHSLLCSPEALFPVEYFNYIISKLNGRDCENVQEDEIMISGLLVYFDRLLLELENDTDAEIVKYCRKLNFSELFDLVGQFVRKRGDKKQNAVFMDIEHRYRILIRKSRLIVKKRDSLTSMSNE